MVPRPAKFSTIKELHYKYHMLINGLYDKILIMQSGVYVINNIETEYIRL